MVSLDVTLAFEWAIDGSRLHPLLSSRPDVRQAQNVQAHHIQGWLVQVFRKPNTCHVCLLKRDNLVVTDGATDTTMQRRCH